MDNARFVMVSRPRNGLIYTHEKILCSIFSIQIVCMSDNFAQTVKQQADIVRIIGEYVKLRKTGAQNYTGLCPFHKEKTGSFSVNATHSYFYCFGCHEKGDVFTFVMKMENISFPEAVRAVAAKAGFRCRSASSVRRKRRARLGCGGS